MVSKFHAAIERRDGAASSCRTLAAPTARSSTAGCSATTKPRINEGDRIQIGPIVATVTVGPPRAETGKVDEMVAGWLNREGSVTRSYQDDSQTDRVLHDDRR